MHITVETKVPAFTGSVPPAVILAAGEGHRLNGVNGGSPKPLTPILGLTLLERAVLSCKEVGVTEFYVVIGYRSHIIVPYLSALEQRLSVSIQAVENPNWREGNGSSALSAASYISRSFFLLMCDHLFDPAILRLLLTAGINTTNCLLAVDRYSERVFDLNDATKVELNQDIITGIGKEKASFDAVDTGLFLCQPSLFDALEVARDRGQHSLSAGLVELIRSREFRAVTIGKRFWFDVDTPKSLGCAKRALLRSLSKPDEDGFVARYLNRPVSTMITRLLAESQITPNQVSVLSFVMALISSLSFVTGNAIIGAFFVQLSSVVDGCDGEIARLKYMQSSLGDFIDAVLDRYADGFVFFGFFYYSLTHVGNSVFAGIYWSSLMISAICVLAILGNLMVSYTSAKSVANFGYRYRGRWVAAGRGRDVRLFQLFIGGLMTYFHPIFALFTMLIIAIQTNAIVLRRIFFSLHRFRNNKSLI